jgi:hypothetical protein
MFFLKSKKKCNNCKRELLDYSNRVITVDNYKTFGGITYYCSECVKLINNEAGITSDVRDIIIDMYNNKVDKDLLIKILDIINNPGTKIL